MIFGILGTADNMSWRIATLATGARTRTEKTAASVSSTGWCSTPRAGCLGNGDAGSAPAKFCSLITIPYGQQAAGAVRYHGTNHQKSDLVLAALDFNFKGPEAFRDLKVRRAFAHAINKDAIAKALSGFPFVVNSPISKRFDYFDPDVRTYAFDQAKRRRCSTKPAT